MCDVGTRSYKQRRVMKRRGIKVTGKETSSFFGSKVRAGCFLSRLLCLHRAAGIMHHASVYKKASDAAIGKDECFVSLAGYFSNFTHTGSREQQAARTVSMEPN